jgi:hypothetical protein
MFSDYIYVLISEIIFKKNYFNIFLKLNTLKIKRYPTLLSKSTSITVKNFLLGKNLIKDQS